MMGSKIYFKINEHLPVFGSVTGAITQVHNITQYLPSWESIISCVIITIVGGITGYLIKLLLDKILKR
jgi:hypothetical protein